MRLSELKTGDIIAIKGCSWLAKRIQWFMKLQARKKYGVKLPIYLNHTMIVTDPKRLRVAEAIGKGFVNHSIWEQYNTNNLKNMVIFRLKKPLSKAEKTKLNLFVVNLAFKNIEYEIFNFFWWAVFVFSNGKVNWSPKGSQANKKLFCFEASVLILDHVREIFVKPSNITTVDLQMDERFNQHSLEK